MRKISPCLSFAVLLVFGCSGGEGEAISTDVDATQAETVESDAVDVASIDTPDLAPTDTVDARLPQDTGELELVPGEIGDNGALPAPGEAGYPCTVGEDCIEGYCIVTPNGKQCTVTCQEECPFDWICAPLGSGGPDQVSVCVARFVSLCRPCESNAECAVDGVDAGQACIPYGASGNFCGEKCAADEDCPDGYECESTKDLVGNSVKQCTKSDGECTCTQWAANPGACTVILADNALGKCMGPHQCMYHALT